MQDILKKLTGRGENRDLNESLAKLMLESIKPNPYVYIKGDTMLIGDTGLSACSFLAYNYEIFLDGSKERGDSEEIEALMNTITLSNHILKKNFSSIQDCLELFSLQEEISKIYKEIEEPDSEKQKVKVYILNKEGDFVIDIHKVDMIAELVVIYEHLLLKMSKDEKIKYEKYLNSLYFKYHFN